MIDRDVGRWPGHFLHCMFMISPSLPRAAIRGHQARQEKILTETESGSGFMNSVDDFLGVLGDLARENIFQPYPRILQTSQ